MRFSRRSTALAALCCAVMAVLLFQFLRPGAHAPSISFSAAKVISSPIPAAPASASTSVEDEFESPVEMGKFRFATHWGKEIDPILSAFSAWTQRYIAADAQERTLLEPEGLRLAQVRRPVFHSLIKENPKHALAEAVPAVVRQQLPASIEALLEDRITGRGDFEVLGRTSPKNVPSISRHANINGRLFDAHVFGQRLSQMTMRQVSLHGVAVDDDLALSESPLRAFEEGETVPAEKPLATDSCVVSQQPTAPISNGPRAGAVAAESGDKVYWLCRGGHLEAAAAGLTAEEGSSNPPPYANLGARSILVILVDFEDLPGGPSTPEQARENLQKVASFLKTNSTDQISFPTLKVTPVLRMPRGRSAYEARNGENVLLADARAAAQLAGYEPMLHDFEVVAFDGLNYPWSGLGFIGSRGAWISGEFAAGTVAHELGHNLGLWHANAWISPTISGNGGRHEEYGNIFDAMGSDGSPNTYFPLNHFNANFKKRLGWLSTGNIETVTATGVYRIYAHDLGSRLEERKYAIRIPAGLVRSPIAGIFDDQGSPEIEDYWIEFRRGLTEEMPATVDGAVIYWGNDEGTASANRLLDMTPDTFGLFDAPLQAGKTFSDPEPYLEIKTLQAGGSGTNAYLDISISIQTPPFISIAEAADNSELTFTAATNHWIGQTLKTHDGVDALSSGTTKDGEAHTLETIVTGPGAISFWWKVSSEPVSDKMSFSIDSVETAGISGEVNWEKRVYNIAAGQHTLRWTYRKDANVLAGADRAWLDEISFIRGDHGPHINRPPSPQSLASGETAAFQVDAAGTSPLSFIWLKDGAPLSAANSPSLVLTNVQANHAGAYSVIVSNHISSVESARAFLTVIPNIPIAEAADFESVTWATDSASPWRGQAEISHDGVDAVQAAPIGNGSDTTLGLRLTGPGILKFWWKVSSEEDYDILSLNLDGALVEEHSGEFQWTQKTMIIPSGMHTVEWTYYKDMSDKEGLDSAWIDQVEFEPAGNIAPLVVVQPQPQAVSAGGVARFSADVAGAAPLHFQWLRNNAPILPRSGVSGVNSLTLIINGVRPEDAGQYSLEVTNSLGRDASAAAALELVELSLADAVEQPGRGFTFGGAGLWGPQEAVHHDGLHAAESPNLADNEFAFFETVVPGPGKVSFWWMVESELDYDFLSFELDGSQTLARSGSRGWEYASVDFGPGSHTLRWKYKKDQGLSIGRDKAWVDQIDIIAADTPPRISNLIVNGAALSGSVDRLVPFSGNVVIEVSSNLTQWSAISTNQITSTNFNFQCGSGNASAQFVRAKIQ